MNKLFFITFIALIFLFSGICAYAQNKKKPDNTITQKIEGSKLLTVEEQEILEKTKKIEVLEIGNGISEVYPSNSKNQKLNEKDRFHGYQVVQTVYISKTEDKKDLVAKLFSAVGEGSQNRCFNPRHGIRATYQGKTIELLICFECGWIYAFNGDGYKFESIDHSLQDILNKFLGKTEE